MEEDQSSPLSQTGGRYSEFGAADTQTFATQAGSRIHHGRGTQDVSATLETPSQQRRRQENALAQLKGNHRSHNQAGRPKVIPSHAPPSAGGLRQLHTSSQDTSARKGRPAHSPAESIRGTQEHHPPSSRLHHKDQENYPVEPVSHTSSQVVAHNAEQPKVPDPSSLSTPRARSIGSSQVKVKTAGQNPTRLIPSQSRVSTSSKKPAENEGDAIVPNKGPQQKSHRTTSPNPVFHFRIPLSRTLCRIPQDQMEILNKRTSWVPSVAGEQFPGGNIPIGLLQVLNESATEARKAPGPAHSARKYKDNNESIARAKATEILQSRHAVERRNTSSGISETSERSAETNTGDIEMEDEGRDRSQRDDTEDKDPPGSNSESEDAELPWDNSQEQEQEHEEPASELPPDSSCPDQRWDRRYERRSNSQRQRDKDDEHAVEGSTAVRDAEAEVDGPCGLSAEAMVFNDDGDDDDDEAPDMETAVPRALNDLDIGRARGTGRGSRQSSQLPTAIEDEESGNVFAQLSQQSRLSQGADVRVEDVEFADVEEEAIEDGEANGEYEEAGDMTEQNRLVTPDLVKPPMEEMSSQGDQGALQQILHEQYEASLRKRITPESPHQQPDLHDDIGDATDWPPLQAEERMTKRKPSQSPRNKPSTKRIKEEKSSTWEPGSRAAERRAELFRAHRMEKARLAAASRRISPSPPVEQMPTEATNDADMVDVDDADPNQEVMNSSPPSLPPGMIASLPPTQDSAARSSSGIGSGRRTFGDSQAYATFKASGGRQSDSDFIFGIFRSSYRSYKGSKNHFVAQCRRIKRIQAANTFKDYLRWDDFVVRHHTDYQAYVAQQCDEGEDPIPYEEYYQSSFPEPVYTRRILGPVTLEDALSDDRLPATGPAQPNTDSLSQRRQLPVQEKGLLDMTSTNDLPRSTFVTPSQLQQARSHESAGAGIKRSLPADVHEAAEDVQTSPSLYSGRSNGVGRSSQREQSGSAPPRQTRPDVVMIDDSSDEEPAREAERRSGPPKTSRSDRGGESRRRLASPATSSRHTARQAAVAERGHGTREGDIESDGEPVPDVPLTAMQDFVHRFASIKSVNGRLGRVERVSGRATLRPRQECPIDPLSWEL